MIEHGDLSLPARVQVLDGYTRPWQRCFLRTACYRTVFAGFIEQMDRSMYEGTRVVVVDAMTRLRKRQVSA